ncbi:MAG: TolC family protein [Gammaproteobacteria bacterium]|nr:MAG: TolC family protein [Gammaproteobacteria bacterium]
MKLHHVAVAVVLGIAPAIPAGAETFSLEQATAHALAHNPNLLAVREQTHAAGARTEAASGARLPELGLSYSVSRSNNPLEAFANKLNTRRVTAADFEPARVNHPETESMYATSLALRLPLYAGGKLSADLANAAETEKHARLQYTRARELVTFQVLEAYLRLQAAREGLTIADDALKSAQEHARTTAQLAREGRIVVSDKLTAEVSLAAHQAQREQAATRLGRARDRLKLVMGLPLDSAIDILPLALDDAPATVRHLAEAETAALARRKDLEGLRALAAAAQARVKGAQAAHKPKVDVITSGNWYDKNFDAADNSWSVMGVARLDLYAGGRHTADVAARQAEARELEHRVRAYEQTVREEVRSAFDARREAQTRYGLARAVVAQARDSVRLVKERYGQGRTILIDLLQAERALVEARSEALASGVALRTNEAALALAEGTFEATEAKP